MDEKEKPPEQVMFQMVTGYWVSQIMGTVAELKLPDHLAQGPKTNTELAELSGAHPSALARLMRACVSLGLFRQEGAHFQLTPLGAVLQSDTPQSMRGWALAQTAPGHWLPWGHLRDAVRTNQSQPKKALGVELFDHYKQHPAEAHAFTSAMRNLSAQVVEELVRLAEVPAEGTMVDVGGASGNLVTALLQAHPKAKGVVVDLPHVAEDANAAFKAAKVADRCQFVAGDFFKEIPKGDLYILKWILHDWNDEQCVTLLKNCARSMTPQGRLLAIEMVIPSDGRPSAAPLMDLNMLVLLPGRERTLEEYKALFSAAGLRLHGAAETRSPFQIVEARRA